VSNSFWQAKIWGLLHDPALKSLYSGKNAQGAWQKLLPLDMKEPVQADHIAAGSDRPAWDKESRYGKVDYDADKGLKISHLLSGESQSIFIKDFGNASSHQDRQLQNIEIKIIQERLIPLLKDLEGVERYQKAYWWLWRCLPVEISKTYGDETILLPADTRIPDCSVWSHNSLTSAIAGALTGFEEGQESRPYLGIFTMTPVQELIKASRKMQDFWAGSWLLHYLSAKVCWKLACEFGPDSLIYPCLYEQPLIDLWLTQKWQDFSPWINEPNPKRLLTAGFPNVIVAILPKESFITQKANAIEFARNALQQSWQDIGNQVFKKLSLVLSISEINKQRLWNEWLKHQWETYSISLPLGNSIATPELSEKLSKGQGKIVTSSEKIPEKGRSDILKHKRDFLKWVKSQHDYCQINLLPEDPLDSNQLSWNAEKFDKKSLPSLAELSTYNTFNVGLWWAQTFYLLRQGLEGVKNCREWQLPSAYSPRSTISGIGPVLHPQQYNRDGKPIDWVAESVTKAFWGKVRGWFDGREQLNATEVVKRGLQKILADVLNLDSEDSLASAYPDLTVGTSGLLHKFFKEKGEEEIGNYRNICGKITRHFEWTNDLERTKWGIPWIDENFDPPLPHPRLLNVSWLLEDAPEDSDLELLKKGLNEQISFNEGSNPTDWYVLAAGDGDDMNKWLKGEKLQPYENYIAEGWPEKSEQWVGFEEFLKQTKRMGPATHAALSRALLDFSNQLVPYLTEQRYAGRLIYGGGDDVLAYTNLWEWDKWLWDIRQCFKGEDDPCEDDPNGKFDSKGDYWQWQGNEKANLTKRPLFTMGRQATISFGITIAHHSVPLAIALENMWEAEEEAKEHEYIDRYRESDRKPCYKKKDAVQVRVIYGNGNILKATCKFDTFQQWKSLLNLPELYPALFKKLEPALFEQAATVWEQHPAPIHAAIDPWCVAFCDRREKLTDSNKDNFREALAQFLKELWVTTAEQDRDREVKNWLKLAAFIIRKRDIQIN
jgi:CRISPR-associated protein Cmr2